MLPLLYAAGKYGIKKGVDKLAEKAVPGYGSIKNEAYAIKPLNQYEDLVVRDIANPYSPMHKDVNNWTDFDFQRAVSSPGYNYNRILREKAQEYQEKREILNQRRYNNWKYYGVIKGNKQCHSSVIKLNISLFLPAQ